MDLYFKELSKINILAPEDEEFLWQKYKQEDDYQSRQELIKAYQPLVFKVAKQISDRQDVLMDLIQEGNIGLIDAVDTYNPSRGTKFSTFAIYHIRGRGLDYLKNGIKELSFPLDIYPDEFEDKVVDKDAFDRIIKSLKELPDREKAIIEGIYLADKKADSLALEMEISLSYLYRLQKKAIKRLRGKLSRFIMKWK
ncbi:sigma-70 family RNA polymerase sigma factor [Natronospora cellulosivora (SeqCode)]